MTPVGTWCRSGRPTAGAVDDIMSRLATISDSGGTLASYKYLGLGTIVREDYPHRVTSSIPATFASIELPSLMSYGP
jgi:hypothetical protein